MTTPSFRRIAGCLLILAPCLLCWLSIEPSWAGFRIFLVAAAFVAMAVVGICLLFSSFLP